MARNKPRGNLLTHVKVYDSRRHAVLCMVAEVTDTLPWKQTGDFKLSCAPNHRPSKKIRKIVIMSGDDSKLSLNSFDGKSKIKKNNIRSSADMNHCITACQLTMYDPRPSRSGSAFIKPDQRNPWIKDQLGNALLSTYSYQILCHVGGTSPPTWHKIW